ncbi:hypothetical protein SAMN04487930_105189 [Cytophaga hutchinsonii ATCC 33406]|nr:hypothetical protein SAMN04487930_105189 [Cytophaga hutchinsonii ATCC 33406]
MIAFLICKIACYAFIKMNPVYAIVDINKQYIHLNYPAEL